MFRYKLGLSPEQRIMHGRGEVGPLALSAVEDSVGACEGGLPLAYALGRTDFAGSTFVVTPDVLIPRPDTEWLVQRGGEWIKDSNKLRTTMVDLGCGSGCIGITLALRHPSLKVILADVSQAALAVAKQNATRLGVLGQCSFMQGDWLQWAKRRERFDLILCNPPYVTSHDDPRLAQSVKDNEPSLALFLEEDPEDFFFRLGRKAVSHLQSGGLFAVEVGYDTAWPARTAFKKIKALARGQEIHDFTGLERVIWGIRK